MFIYEKKDAEKSKQRVEAWWEHEIIDRAVIKIIAPLHPEKPEEEENIDNLEKFFTDPGFVIPHEEKRLSNTYFAGEALPVAYPYRVVAALAGYLGCPLSFIDRLSVWAEPIIKDVHALPDLSFNPQNKWWKISRALLQEATERGKKYNYSVAIPDLNGPTEILARLRGTQELAMDFIDNPEYIKPVVEKITESWFRYWQESVNITKEAGGYLHWMQIWSEKPSVDLQSDFSCVISPQMFNKHFLPSIEKQTRMVERTIYHLDGPGAVGHLDALLELPELNCIQWVPGAGAKPVVEWISLLKKIQNAGKLVYVLCRKENVEKLLSELNPRGLMLLTFCDSHGEAKELLKNVEKWTVINKKIY
jgi:hypothetical protein